MNHTNTPDDRLESEVAALERWAKQATLQREAAAQNDAFWKGATLGIVPEMSDLPAAKTELIQGVRGKLSLGKGHSQNFLEAAE